MRRSALVLLVPLLFLRFPAATQDKSRYDISLPGDTHPGSLGRVEGFGIDGKIISRRYGAFSAMPGGFYTYGTTQGLSASGLDSAATVTFGHPFAKTSYGVLAIDGTWGKPSAFFDLTRGTFEPRGDSITLTYVAPGLARYTACYRIDPDGRRLHLAAQLQNLDSAAHTMGLGFMLDPALGPWGDGALWNGLQWVPRDTVLTEPLPPLSIAERRTGAPGMRITLEFPAGSPSEVVAANWADRLDNESPSFTPSPLRRIYDLVLRLGWTPASLPPGGSIEKSYDIVLQAADFGDKAFLRWNFPDHLSLDNGTLFPASYASMALIANLTGQQRPAGVLQFHGDGELVSGPPASGTVLGPSARTFARVSATMLENYQPAVVNLVLVYAEGETIVDSLVRPVYVPAVPVSDTGLVVTVDSLSAAHPPAVSLLFEAQRRSTGAKIMNLAGRNVSLYDNGRLVPSFSLGHDTAGQAKSDIVFVLDVTGSMGNEIDAVKNNIIEFADSLQAQGTRFRLGMVTFLDAIENVYDFTTDVAAFKSSVAAQFAHGGGDGPENSLDALWRATELPFDPQAARVFIWITDADYHLPNDGSGYTLHARQDVITRLLENGVTVYAIGSLAFQTDWYNPIVSATGGLYYDIDGRFRDILLDIGRRHANPRYLLTYQAEPAASHALTLWVHYAGLGGSAAASFSSASGSVVSVGSVRCYPNPFNPATVLRLRIPGQGRASLTVFDLLGQQVRTFAEIAGPGTAEVQWDATDDRGARVAGGVYFVRCCVRAPSGEIISQDFLKIMYLK